MNGGEKPMPGRRFLPVVAAVMLLLLPLGYSLASYVAAGEPEDDGAPFLEMPSPEHTECVRDVEYMRYRHMELLKEVTIG